jgi:hypothetical protein
MRLIGSYLVNWAVERLAILERQSVAKGEPFDTESAVRIFSAVYTSEMIYFLSAARMKITPVPFIALGAVIGCTDEAFAVARLQLRAYRKGLYNWRDLNTIYRPALHFIMRLMADYLGEPPHVLQGESLTEPHYRALFDHWREPDAEVLAACDAHTYRNCEFGEFRLRHEWKRNPIEILLLFKLRALLGLPNPSLDHPLMNTPLGKLPPEIPFNAITRGPDDLVYRVRLTLKQDGYDEPAIFAAYRTE